MSDNKERFTASNKMEVEPDSQYKDWLKVYEFAGGGLRATLGPGSVQALREYFEANPLPKLWQDSEPGEVWILTLKGGTKFAALRDYDNDFIASSEPEGQRYWDKDSEEIVAGRRIWPENEED